MNDGAGIKAKDRKRRQPLAPSDKEYDAVDTAATQPRPWREAAPDWSCACCGRRKREVCRKSNAGKWTARIHRHDEYRLENDPVSVELRRSLYPAFIADPMIGSSFTRTICQDCAGIASSLKAQRRDLPEVYLSIDDIRAGLFNVDPHAPHVFDLNVLTERAIGNVPLVEAMIAFREHANCAGHVRVLYSMAVETMGKARARDWAARKVECERGLPDGVVSACLNWLFDEAARLNWRAAQQDIAA